ncbi:MAG: glycogen synthase [Gemmatimonadetes bacterium]|nr:glycogen synthase [Gemmatimonadota bacterium]
MLRTRRRSAAKTMVRAPRVDASALTVVHVAAEYWPVAQIGGLAEAVHGLAAHQQRAGARVMAIVPFYRGVRQAGLSLEGVGRPWPVRVGKRDEQVRVHRWARAGEPDVLFVDHPPSFDRLGVYGEGGADYPDNAQRFALFSLAALRLLPEVAPGPLVLHAHDWHAALVLVYLRTLYEGVAPYSRMCAVLSVHNAGYQGHFPPESVPAVGLPAETYDWRRLEWYGRANWLKGGMSYADAVVTVSPTHAAELRTPVGGFGLHEAFVGLGDRFVGILNGIDCDAWNPATDALIAHAFSAADLAGKRPCKAALQQELGLTVDPHIPLAVMSARLVAQKGFDLVLAGLVARFPDVQFAFLGQGEERYQAGVGALAQRFPARVVLERNFHDALEHRLLAGADILLMPSLYEPCGLTQMRAQRYGVLPVARRVGGLADTIEHERTGFLFEENSLDAFEGALRRALEVYRDPREWEIRVRRAMRRDFSWTGSVSQYLDLYRRTLDSVSVCAPRKPSRRAARRRQLPHVAQATPAV